MCNRALFRRKSAILRAPLIPDLAEVFQPMAMSGSDFFGVEGGGEAKYEVSHVVGKGSYGIVW